MGHSRWYCLDPRRPANEVIPGKSNKYMLVTHNTTNTSSTCAGVVAVFSGGGGGGGAVQEGQSAAWLIDSMVHSTKNAIDGAVGILASFPVRLGTRLWAYMYLLGYHVHLGLLIGRTQLSEP